MTRDEMLALKHDHCWRANFHAAVERAIEAMDELASIEIDMKSPLWKDAQGELRDQQRFYETQHRGAVENAAEALRNMSPERAASLGAEIATIIPGVIPAHTSVYLAAE